jgi:hypothetical protein
MGERKPRRVQAAFEIIVNQGYRDLIIQAVICANGT